MSDINIKIRHAKRQYSQNLDCSNMNLEYLPNELFNLKNLITLNLANNKIKEIDKQIENFLNLKELNLENNEIEDLPKEILNLANLSNLKLKNNPILSKLKDFDVYWKHSLKNYFAEKNSNKLNLITSEYSQTEINFLNQKNLNINSTKNNLNSNQNTLVNSDFGNLLNKKDSNFPFSTNSNELKRNMTSYSKTSDFKNISFANINVNSNISIGGVNNDKNYSVLLNNLNTSSKNHILKDGEVLYKPQKNSIKAQDENYFNEDENNKTKIKNDEINQTFSNNQSQKENLNNSTMNKTFSNFKSISKKSNFESTLTKDKEIGSFNNLFGKKINPIINSNYQKISPISLKPENLNENNHVNNNYCSNSNSSKNKNRYSSDTKNSSKEKTTNNISLSQNSNSGINNENIYNINIDEKSNKIEELEKKLQEKEFIISDLKAKIFDFEKKINMINIENNISNTNLIANNKQSLKSNSFKFHNKPVEDEISQKRNWMENNTSIIGGPGNLDNSIFIGNLPSSEKSLEDIKELESKLQKEIMNNKRMKNQIENLSQQIASFQNNFNSNSDELLKKIKEINYEQIDIKNQIGQGGFSIIYKGNYLNIPVAVKILFDPNVNEELLNEFNNELKMLFLLRHPNIISLFGTSRSGQKLVIITEFLENGSLFDFLHKSSKETNLSNSIKIRIIKQILNAMLYLHDCDIVHRDLKSHNVLLDDNYNIKLCDFGLAKTRTDLNIGCSKFSGTPAYMAPEILQKKSYDEKVDVFAFGTLIWEIFTRKIPHEGVELADLKQRILNDEKLFIPKTIPKDIANIIDACRMLDPRKRPTFLEISKMSIKE